MNNTDPQSNDAAFFFLSTSRPESSFPEFSKPVFLFQFNREEKYPLRGIDGQGACFGVPCPGNRSPRQPPDLRPTGLGVTLRWGPDRTTQTLHVRCGSLDVKSLDHFQISNLPQRTEIC